MILANIKYVAITVVLITPNWFFTKRDSSGWYCPRLYYPVLKECWVTWQCTADNVTTCAIIEIRCIGEGIYQDI